MSKFHSLRKMVKEARTSTCTLIIVVENGLDHITVRVNEHLTDWARLFPNTSQKFHRDGATALRTLKLMHATCLRLV
jgi:hypothetical protein